MDSYTSTKYDFQYRDILFQRSIIFRHPSFSGKEVQWVSCKGSPCNRRLQRWQKSSLQHFAYPHPKSCLVIENVSVIWGKATWWMCPRCFQSLNRMIPAKNLTDFFHLILHCRFSNWPTKNCIILANFIHLRSSTRDWVTTARRGGQLAACWIWNWVFKAGKYGMYFSLQMRWGKELPSVSAFSIFLVQCSLRKSSSYWWHHLVPVEGANRFIKVWLTEQMGAP